MSKFFIWVFSLGQILICVRMGWHVHFMFKGDLKYFQLSTLLTA